MRDQEEKKVSIPIEEQETHISFNRDQNFASIYASDTTQITRLDNLCKSSPDVYQCIEETKHGKRYILKDKTLICFRAKKRELTDEQRMAAGIRMKKYQESKRAVLNSTPEV